MASVQKRPNGKWRARYQAPDGQWHAKHFNRKVDAEQFLDRVRGDLSRGEFVDPKRARTPFGEYVDQWRTVQVQHKQSTAENRDARLDVHVLPFFGKRPIGAIRRSEVQSWVAERADVMAPATLQNVFAWFRAVMRAAVNDGLIAKSPCEGINLPRVPKQRSEIALLSTEQVLALIGATPERFRAMVILAAGSGLRQGELLGLDVSRVDFLHRRVKVDRQLQTPARGVPELRPPKTDQAYRTVPLDDTVLAALSEHIRVFQPGIGLLFTTVNGAPMRRNSWGDIWRRIVDRADGVPAGTRLHDLRHYFASLLIAHGASVKAVQVALGHWSAQETLDVYGHLWPNDEDRLRDAVRDVFGAALVSRAV